MGLFRSFVTLLTPAPRGRVEEVNGVAMADADLDPEIAYGGHVCLAMTFFLTTLAYTAFALFAFFTRPETETFLQLPTSQFPPVDLTLDASCDNPPNCGAITFGANYTGIAACAAPAADTYTVAANATRSVTGVVRRLCFTEQTLFSVEHRGYFEVPGLQVDFQAINPGVNNSVTPHADAPELRATANVRVTAPTTDVNFRRLVNMDTWQVKTLVVGQNIKRRDGVVVSRSLFPVSIQYEGKRPNWRATLFVAMAPLSNVFDTERPGTLLDTIASIGGATSMITAALIVATPIVGVLLPGEVKKGATAGDADDFDDDSAARDVTDAEPISDHGTPAEGI